MGIVTSDASISGRNGGPGRAQVIQCSRNLDYNYVIAQPMREDADRACRSRVGLPSFR